eukprot:gene10478-10637_t
MKHPLKQPYCIVTGANAGIGKEVTAGLMAQGAHVVMACRNMDACLEAQQQLERQEPTGSCQCCRLDLSSLQSVRAFAEKQAQELQRREQAVSVLVNNAGVMGVSSGPRGEDQHLAVNHLGPFLLTNLLLPHLQQGSRVVNVASRAHLWSGRLRVEGDSILPGPQFWFCQYARSKLCNILFTLELQRRFQRSKGIIATAVSPGFVNSSIFRSLPASASWLGGLASLVAKTPAEGARVVVYAASSPDLSDAAPVPLLLHNCKPLQPSVSSTVYC